MAKKYWLMKSEPDVYSIDDLESEGSTCWEGVRNYQARNNMQAMTVGDEVLYYHSNAKPPGVVGIARVCKDMVDVEFVSKAEEPLGLSAIKGDPAFADMDLVRYGRLSVQSVKKKEFDRVKKLVGL